MGQARREAVSAPPGRIGDRHACLRERGRRATLPAPAEFCPSGAAGPISGGAGPVAEPPEAVVRVNIGLDAPPYGVGEPVDEPASLTALVNKYTPCRRTMFLSWSFSRPAIPHPRGPVCVQRPARPFFRWRTRRQRRACACTAPLPTALTPPRSGSISATPPSRGRRRPALSARAGFSEHQTGLALDINVASLSARFEGSRGVRLAVSAQLGVRLYSPLPPGKEDLTSYLFEPVALPLCRAGDSPPCHEQGWTLEEF